MRRPLDQTGQVATFPMLYGARSSKGLNLLHILEATRTRMRPIRDSKVSITFSYYSLSFELFVYTRETNY